MKIQTNKNVLPAIHWLSNTGNTGFDIKFLHWNGDIGEYEFIFTDGKLASEFILKWC